MRGFWVISTPGPVSPVVLAAMPGRAQSPSLSGLFIDMSLAAMPEHDLGSGLSGLFRILALL